MSSVSPALEFIMVMSQAQTVLNRRFDSCLGGLSFNEFVILYHLNQSKDMRLRRIDLAVKLGLTASGVTRLLLPMEKIGLVTKEANPQDARVSYVVLRPAGRESLLEAIEQAEIALGEVIDEHVSEIAKDFSVFLRRLIGAFSVR